MFIKFDVYYLNIESRKDITMEYEKQLRESGELYRNANSRKII